MTEEFDDPKLNRTYSFLEGCSFDGIKTFLTDNYYALCESNQLWKTTLKKLNLPGSECFILHKLNKHEVLEIIKRNFHSGLSSTASLEPKTGGLTSGTFKYESPEKDQNGKGRSGSSAFRSYSNSIPKTSYFDNYNKRDSSVEFSTKCNSQLTDSIICSAKVENMNHYNFSHNQSEQLTENSKGINGVLQRNYLSNKRVLEGKSQFENLNAEISVETMPVGLKDISKRVIEYLKANESTNYKAVSEALLGQLSIDDLNESKNIKRRIYDIINVLKAINCLKQDSSKRIAINKDFSQKQNLSEDFATKEISRQSLVNNRKSQAITFQSDINTSIKNLLSKNKCSDIDESRQKTDRLALPFLCLFIGGVNHPEFSNLSITSTSSKSKLFVTSDSQISAGGDFDILKRLLSLNNRSEA